MRLSCDFTPCNNYSNGTCSDAQVSRDPSKCKYQAMFIAQKQVFTALEGISKTVKNGDDYCKDCDTCKYMKDCRPDNSQAMKVVMDHMIEVVKSIYGDNNSTARN